MPDVLVYADTLRSPELRHELPLDVPDPFLYGEADGVRHVLVNAVEGVRMRGLDVALHPPEEYGLDELRRSGRPRDEIGLELCARAVRDWGIESALTPWAFPLEVADRLRADGVELRVDREHFDRRRRVKNEAELAGIRRAQRAADAAMAAARDALRAGPTTCELVKQEVERTASEHGCTLEIAIVSHGPQTAVGHDLGSGPIAPGEPVIVDLAPRDRESRCYADMTRTFVVGEAPAELVEWHRLCLEALEVAIASTRPGAQDADLFHATSEFFLAHGQPTQLDKPDGVPLEDGFYHSLGHGVGLEVHEPPYLSLLPNDRLVAGELIALEPGLYRRGFGGVRLEDLVLVTQDGCENLTDHPYELEP